MKTKTSNLALRAIGAAALLAAAAGARAGQVQLPHTFTPGTTARAAQVNGNFSELASAVNDNDSRIGTLTNRADAADAAIAGKQNRVTGTCAAGSSIRAVAADGTVTCETDDVGASYTGASPITVSGTTIGLASGGITDAHVSASAAIAASKIAGDAGAEFNSSFWTLNPVPTTATSLGSITVSAPGPGVILLFLNGNASSTGVNFLHVVGIGTSATSPSVERAFTPTTNTQIFTLNWATTVASAGTYTYHAFARKVDPTACCTMWVYDVNLIGIFIPKRY